MSVPYAREREADERADGELRRDVDVAAQLQVQELPAVRAAGALTLPAETSMFIHS